MKFVLFGSQYDEIDNFAALEEMIKGFEKKNLNERENYGRLMYLAIPPTNYVEVSIYIYIAKSPLCNCTLI